MFHFIMDSAPPPYLCLSVCLSSLKFPVTHTFYCEIGTCSFNTDNMF